MADAAYNGIFGFGFSWVFTPSSGTAFGSLQAQTEEATPPPVKIEVAKFTPISGANANKEQVAAGRYLVQEYKMKATYCAAEHAAALVCMSLKLFGTLVCTYGDGSTERDYTYCTDIVDGVVAAIDRDLGFEIINLGESRTTKLSELVHIIEDALGKKAVLKKLPMQPGDVLMTCADVSKAKRLLGYNPSTTVEQGVKRFVEWYREAAL